jgi:hypothetical protein
MHTPGHLNRLAHEPSPYLRQHQHNPVDWYPWGPEALERARREDKPILLSVGYSACHWCHVMAHESFEDEATAAVMNAHFVNIKIDREERPDLDQLYQGVVQLMGRGGGWPLTVFLMPDLRPFYGGTYFPPAPRHGLPAFRSLLSAIAEGFARERAQLEQQAQTFKEGLTEYAASGLDRLTRAPLTGDDVVTAARALSRRVDRVNGGFGNSGPKFPNPMNVALLLRGARRANDAQLRADALFTLEKMVKGGVFDQLGGGFHRYSVDERWLVPHFEKMLYDNAQLLHLLAEAWQVDPRPLWREAATATVGWLTREMTAPDGPFYAAQDADSEGEEGRFFVWRASEVRELLPPLEANAVLAHYGVTEHGNFEHGTAIFERVVEVPALASVLGVSAEQAAAALARGKATLFATRARRVPPGRDDKVLTGWNGLMLRGLALAGRAFQEPTWVDLARRAADRLLATVLRADGSVARSLHDGQPRLEGMLEDVGDFAAGLTSLYQATFDAKYLEAAERLCDDAVRRFWDPARLAYLAAPREQGDLLVPTYALHDNAFPSGASSLTEAQLTLAALTGHTRHLEQAATYLERLRSELLENPMAFGHLWLAADVLADGSPEVTVVGPRAQWAPFQACFDASYLPTVAVQCVDPSAPLAAVTSDLVASRGAREGASAYLCRNAACEAPVSDVGALKALLSR